MIEQDKFLYVNVLWLHLASDALKPLKLTETTVLVNGPQSDSPSCIILQSRCKH